ncbi:DNA-binding transcriptional LysR family regulator [Rubrivivax gelatinosus]|uniref:LysR family transcriptional regulator n=1 Tax=Rubrivivax gelatinosus TaxID=28068 RepID=UPI0018CA92B2|nr:LysR family transcriptional regulator [Rubrivivax gelatinosus]MBG6079801.1 DNA-binding transcriptional LysR family regulator [Rubrivivax gelatinosus]
MDQLRAMKVFVRVVDEGGFARAARALDMAPPVVTRVVAELEAHLGARLLNRTTRRVALTEVGESYLERSRRILAEVDEADALAGESTRELSGPLRLLCPSALAAHQLVRHLTRFAAQHPKLALELAAPGRVETVDEDYDVTLLTLRDPIDGDFVARRLARSEVLLCAAPGYLSRHGRLRHPRDLARHELLFQPAAQPRGLVFFRGGEAGAGEATETVMPERAPVLRCDDVQTQLAAAVAGLGVASLPTLVLEEVLADGRLERVLPAWRLSGLSIWAAMPSRKHVPARTRALLEFLIQAFGGDDRDPWLAACGGPLALVA